jgi:D-serine deaminase-like pyridoxal phosphate-dependent protein
VELPRRTGPAGTAVDRKGAPQAAYSPAVPPQSPSAPVEVPPLPAGLDTPVLVVFIDRVAENIDRLQRSLDLKGVRLRPHAKTHKSVRIAQMQIGAGASGLTVGTLGEAEVFTRAGLRDLFIAYPVWAEGPKANRLRALHRAADLRVGVDSADGAERLAAAVSGSRRPLHVLVELDSGGHRTGVATPAQAVEVASAARRLGLHVDGVFTHGGHSYRPGAAETAATDEATALEAGARALEAAGFEVRTVSAGSTPTRELAVQARVNEIRAGTYVLGDRQQWALGSIAAEGIAAVVAATVVSVASDRFVVDAGAKALTKDLPAFVAGYGLLPRWPTAVVERVNDYHGVVSLPVGSDGPRLGDVVAVVPNHICPVVDLFETFVAVLPDGHTESWPVDARGRNG